MEVNVLGPLAVEEQGASIVPSARKPRQVLALLALHADKVVTVPMLMEEIWGDDVPRSAATTLQTYILQLRRLISAALAGDPGRQAKDLLVTQHGGYLLEVRPGRNDAEEFHRLAAAGRHAFDAGQDRRASELLGRGLDLWRWSTFRSAGWPSSRCSGSKRPAAACWSAGSRRTCASAGTGNCSASSGF